jgi:hypothetical protein
MIKIQCSVQSNHMWHQLSGVWVGIYRVWIGEWIYWILIHDSELRAMTVPLLISTIHNSPQHMLSPFQPAMSSPVVPWQWILTLEILQFHVLRSYLHSLPCRTLSNNCLCPLLTTSRHEPCRKHHVSDSLLLHAYLLLWEHVCRTTAQKRFLFTESPLSNGYIRHNIKL